MKVFRPGLKSLKAEVRKLKMSQSFEVPDGNPQ